MLDSKDITATQKRVTIPYNQMQNMCDETLHAVMILFIYAFSVVYPTLSPSESGGWYQGTWGTRQGAEFVRERTVHVCGLEGELEYVSGVPRRTCKLYYRLRRKLT